MVSSCGIHSQKVRDRLPVYSPRMFKFRRGLGPCWKEIARRKFHESPAARPNIHPPLAARMVYTEDFRSFGRPLDRVFTGTRTGNFASPQQRVQIYTFHWLQESSTLKIFDHLGGLSIDRKLRESPAARPNIQPLPAARIVYTEDFRPFGMPLDRVFCLNAPSSAISLEFGFVLSMLFCHRFLRFLKKQSHEKACFEVHVWK
ncbi:hypothetical protein K438DRAFT_1857040 [Mycena galopus ATCC 62051]|nr:hypothetical protein K438DRAFT_1857040 [Mycena galopus ATCC 62051]